MEYHPHLWNPDGEKHIVHLDFYPAEIDEHYHPEHEAIGDLNESLKMLTNCFTDEPHSYDLSMQHEVRKQMQEVFDRHADDDTKGLIRPQKVLSDVRKVLGPNDLFTVRLSEPTKMWIARHYQCHEPNTCLIPNRLLLDGVRSTRCHWVLA